MRILPAIDLINGQCVRLYQGDFSKKTKVADNPEAQLLRFAEAGAEMIHIVDLDGARSGKPEQFELIQHLCAVSAVPIEVGGGIRDFDTVKKYIDAGVARIVLGTSAIEDTNLLQEALSAFADKIAIGIDAKNGKVATNGWETVTNIDYLEFSKQIEGFGGKTIIFTDISRDGTMSGPNTQAYMQLKEAVSCHIVASGGITTMDDLKALSNIGITEAIVGKAIYEGSIVLGGKEPC